MSETTQESSQDQRHWIFWDGDCGFCRRSVFWLLQRDRHHQFRAVPYQTAPAPPMTPQLREACRHAVHVVTADGRVLRGGRAVLFALGKVGYRRRARTLAQKPFIWLVEALYLLVARNRLLFSRFLFRDKP